MRKLLAVFVYLACLGCWSQMCGCRCLDRPAADSGKRPDAGVAGERDPGSTVQRTGAETWSRSLGEGCREILLTQGGANLVVSPDVIRDGLVHGVMQCVMYVHGKYDIQLAWMVWDGEQKVRDARALLARRKSGGTENPGDDVPAFAMAWPRQDLQKSLEVERFVFECTQGVYESGCVDAGRLDALRNIEQVLHGLWGGESRAAYGLAPYLEAESQAISANMVRRIVSKPGVVPDMLRGLPDGEVGGGRMRAQDILEAMRTWPSARLQADELLDRYYIVESEKMGSVGILVMGTIEEWESLECACTELEKMVPRMLELRGERGLEEIQFLYNMRKWVARMRDGCAVARKLRMDARQTMVRIDSSDDFCKMWRACCASAIVSGGAKSRAILPSRRVRVSANGEWGFCLEWAP